ncbi:putative receptor-like protein kinase [Hibiscus syriacus]|uniref:Receptor-like protein kinase n=1 Tax=Hibiscus syriacus TaxID=106335 RepID=A0A6A3C9U6_HIBSY|nr:putative receptor-like protein kinase [Hibiscus syriacus]
MMLSPKHLLFSFLALTLYLSADVSDARPGKSNQCGPSLCGNVEIRWPFRLKGQPHKCGDKRFELECKGNRTVSFPMKYGKFYVLDISYVNQRLRLVDASLVDGNCSIPRSSIPFYNNYYEDIIDPASTMYVVNCTTKMNSSVYVDASRCQTISSSSPWTYSYFFIPGYYLNMSDFHLSCRFVAQFPFMLSNISGLSTSDIYENLLKGVDVLWYVPGSLWSSNLILKVLLTFPTISLAISGQGGFGSVFKGKLRSGRLVAVKVLSKSKANGEDFISEVATIGRIHHVNVVQLIGFCVERSRQALVYNFMANGSLDKIIFSKETCTLSWPNLLEIALGVARGIEYLHKGCQMQILHFDIKPHNILLDENFVPKVSDFGLAKLYSVDDSIISLTAARGTMGYIAPELFYKNIGSISYKADVYSFGMLLMEMVGRRKNLNASVEHSSQIYFPSWIYDRFDRGESMELEDVTEVDEKIARKLIMVAFWCIQMNPTNRPSMRNVLEMLENEVEPLELPPKPLLFSLDTSSEDRSKKDAMDKATASKSSFDL